MGRWVFSLLFLLAAAAMLPPSAAAQIAPGERVSLRETLEKGLRVRTDRERQYIARVLDLVERKVLPRELVLTVFQKARNRNPRVPLVYFREMLAILAAQKGVQIPF